MFKLVENGQSDIPAHDLKDGQVAVITTWLHAYTGKIVMRAGNDLYIIGKPVDKLGWKGWFTLSDISLYKSCRVRLLNSGTTIVME